MVQIDKQFNINKYFQSYIPILREVFLEYYDEEYADIVNNAFDNFSFIGYLTPVGISNLISTLGHKISGKLVDDFTLEAGFSDIKNFKTNAFFFGFEKQENCEFYKVLERKEGYENEVCWIFGIDSKSIDAKEKINEAIKRIDSAKDIFYKYQELFYQEIKPYQEYFDIASRLDELETNSTPEYIIYFIKRLFPFLSKEDKEFYLLNREKLENKETASEYFRKMQCFKNYVSHYITDRIDFSHSGLISYFSDKNEEEMQNPNESKYIKNNRIKYFKSLGIDLGDNYEEYINNPEVRRLWPSKVMINEIEKVKREIYEATIKSFFLTVPMYQENKKTLEETGFTDKRETPFQFQNYLKNCWNISPNYIMKKNFTRVDDAFILHPIIMFSAYCGNNEFDKSIIHELNHLVEEHIKSVFKKIIENGSLMIQVVTECGLNCQSEEPYIRELEKHQYELFNETINDIIANEITDLMHAKGIYLFTEPGLQEENDKNICLYSYSKPLTLDFFNEFRKDIIYARMTGNRSSLYEKIGESNYNALNDLINEFYIYFGTVKNDTRLRKTLNNLQEGNIDSDVEAYNDFLNRSYNILENMKRNRTESIQKKKTYTK